MTNKNATKKALWSSVLALVLCFSMLLGTTYAWFTDSVTSENNIIKSGNLKISLDYLDGDDWVTVEGSSEILDEDALWEPGYADVVYLRMRNEGSLALKYLLNVNIVSETGGVNKAGASFLLSDYIYMGAVDGVDGKTAAYKTREDAIAAVKGCGIISTGYSKSGTLLANSDYVYLAMVVYMPTTIDNEANYDGEHAPKINLGINVVATQHAYEEDSFGADYDAAADLYRNVVLPAGVTAETFAANNAVAVDENGVYYASYKAAVESGASVLYMNPGVDLGTVTHAALQGNLTIYGNGAYISGDGERDLDISKLKDDATVKVYYLDGVGVWGSTTGCTLNINLYSCYNLSKILLSGTTNVNNVSLIGCTANGIGEVSTATNGDTAVYSNANGTIVIDGCVFNGVKCPLNLNHKVAGTQTVVVSGSEFIDCATEGTEAYYAPIRIYAGAENAVTDITVKRCTFTYSEGKAPVNGYDVLLNKIHNSVEAPGSIEAVMQTEGATVYYGVNVNAGSLDTWAGVDYAILPGGEKVVISAYDGDQTVRGMVEGDTTIKTAVVEEGVTNVGNRTFRRCSGLTTVVLPESLTTIGPGVFQSCHNLTTINIPAGVTSIGDYAFGECKSLTSITIPEGVTRIERDTFNASGLIEIELPASVTYIGAQAFRDCDSLTTVYINAESFTIESNTFSNMASPFPATTIYVKNAEMQAYLEGVFASNSATRHITVLIAD